jgi:hypothetical protein
MQTDLFIDIVKGFDSAPSADRKSEQSVGFQKEPVQKQGNKEVPRYKQDKILVNLNGNNLWDYCWLRKKYPDRFDSHYFAEWDLKNERQLNYEKMYGTGKK